VTFEKRGFTLDRFRAAIQAHRTHEEVGEIVRDLQARASAEYAPFKAAVRGLGGEVVIEFWLINACTVEVPPALVGALAALPNVLNVRPDLPAWPVGTVPIKTATNSNNHNADAVQAMGYRGTGYSAGIVDTGQDSNMNGTLRPHVQYFRNASVANKTGGGIGGSLLLANVMVPGTVGADDTNGHGTGVGSIVGASGWNNAGADAGHAPDAGKVGYSICAAAGCGTTLAIEALGWQAATADKALYNIVACNMSYTATPSPIDVVEQAIDAAALNGDILAVTAAANDGASTARSSSTANGLAVAAVSPNSKAVASFSSRGPLSGDTARYYPDISACGVSTVMAARDNESGTYVNSGTSMASPMVCGAGTLLKSVRPGSNALELKALLLCTTEDISAQNPVAPYNTRNAYGMGFLRDDLTANAALKPGTALTSTIASTTTPTTYLLNATPSQKAAVVLTWYRTNLGVTTWSNLNLRVLDGTTVLGSSSDPRNLYEKVVFTAPVGGVVTVEVSAASLDAASVKYALAGTHPFLGGVPSSYHHYGAGCAGSTALPGLSVSRNPVLGQPFTVKLAFAKPGSTAYLLFGVSDTTWAPLTLPMDLGALAPGCTILASGEIIVASPTSASGQVATTLTVPNDPVLRGAEVFNQWAVQDPTVNPLGMAFSQAGKGVIGDF
jgi:hypothetical protein